MRNLHGSGAKRGSFVLTAVNGEYAPETIPLTDSSGVWLPVLALRAYVETLVTGCSFVVDLLRPGGDPNTAAHWYLDAIEWTTAGLQDVEDLTGWGGVRIRAKSGGTAGTGVLSLSWL
jgi:hypothetical protein